jgi:hypothetical protein
MAWEQVEEVALTVTRTSGVSAVWHSWKGEVLISAGTTTGNREGALGHLVDDLVHAYCPGGSAFLV